MIRRVDYRFSIFLSLGCALGFFALLSPAATVPVAAPASVSGTATNPAEPEVVTTDSLGRTTPQGTVLGFIGATGREEYEIASNYLEGKQTGPQKEKLARQLKVLLDREVTVDVDSLSKKPEGDPGNGPTPGLQKVGVAQYGDQSLEILLHRVEQTGGPTIWLFSAETLLKVPDAVARAEPTLAEKLLPKALREIRFLRLPLSVWISCLVILPLVFGAIVLITRGLASVVRSWLMRRFDGFDEKQMAGIIRPVRVLICSILVRLLGFVASTVFLRLFWTRLGTVLIIIAAAWLLVRLTGLAGGLRILRLRKAELLAGITLTELLVGLVKGLWIVGGLFFILRSVGIDVTAAMAGLGVGGIAIAFAAQKTIENLFGTVTVATDQPIHVGDFCQAGNTSGTVEAIGLRSSRIRTLDRTVVTIPNGQLAGMSLENSSQRDKFLFRHNVRLPYETTADQLRDVLGEIRRMMSEHPKIEPSTIRVRLIRFGDSSLEIDVFAYVLTCEGEVFLEIQEELLLRMMDLIEASGTRIAFPPRTTYTTPVLGLVGRKKGKGASEG